MKNLKGSKPVSKKVGNGQSVMIVSGALSGPSSSSKPHCGKKIGVQIY